MCFGRPMLAVLWLKLVRMGKASADWHERMTDWRGWVLGEERVMLLPGDGMGWV